MRVRIPISQHGDDVEVEGVDRKTVLAPDGFYASRKLSKHIVRAGHGHAFAVSKGTRFRIVDLYGEQVVDFMAWVPPDSTTRPSPPSLPLEKMSMAYTRYHLRGVTPAINEALYSNADRPILRITDDTVKVHDMTYMTCFPQMYEKQGLQGHRSCAQNIFEVVQEYGMRDILEVLEPFNCFQNIPNYSLKAMGSSKSGDYIEFEALENLVCVVSSCPYDVDGFNGGNITDILVLVSEEL